MLRGRDWSSEVIALPDVVTSLWPRGDKGGAGKTRRLKHLAGFNFAWSMNETLLPQVELHHKVLFGDLEDRSECESLWENVSPRARKKRFFCEIVEIIEYSFYRGK